MTDKPVRRDVAMTGEITLRGRVLPIGGLKEKVLAAHRSGIRTVILPAENARDIDEIPDNIKQEMTFVTVDHMDEVLVVALRDFRLTSDDSGRSEIIPMTENVHDQGSGASLQV